jgi:hypothetical protein
MTKKLVKVRNATSRTIPLMGKGVGALTIPRGATTDLEPAYYEHYHFHSLRRKRMLVVLCEVEVAPPKPKAESPSKFKPAKRKSRRTSSLIHQGNDQSKAQDQTDGEKDSPEVMNADGK